MKLLIASGNEKKITEMRAILSEIGVEVLSQNDLNIHINPLENGTTFEENAFIKASEFMKAAKMPAIADDSGLEVDALDGAPGIYSARYVKGSDLDRIHALLENMKGIEASKRTARFVCAICCVLEDGRKIAARGECEGVILESLHGSGGFGYDPIFYVPEYQMTFAQMPQTLKNRISHRAKALMALKEKLKENGFGAIK